MIDKLKASDGLLAMAVEGCLEYQTKGLCPPNAVRQSTEKYRAEADCVLQWLNERVSLNPYGSPIKRKDLKADFNEWANGNGGSILFAATVKDKEFAGRIRDWAKRQGALLSEGESGGYPTIKGLALKPKEAVAAPVSPLNVIPFPPR